MAKNSKSDSVTPTVATASESARVYKGERVVDHDLYKLMVAKMRKNVSWNKDDPDYRDIEHCHFFHTVDSSGKPQETSNAIGGHFHQVKLIPAKNGPAALEVSPAMKYVSQKIRGRFRRVAVNVADDIHTHEWEYLVSQRVQIRKPNVEFAKLEAAITSRQDIKVEGVIG